MPFKKGHAPLPGGGRPKGSRNKLNKDILEMVLGVLKQLGGDKFLKETASKNPALLWSILRTATPRMESQEHSLEGAEKLRAFLRGDDEAVEGPESDEAAQDGS